MPTRRNYATLHHKVQNPAHYGLLKHRAEKVLILPKLCLCSGATAAHYPSNLDYTKVICFISILPSRELDLAQNETVKKEKEKKITFGGK